MRYVYETNDIMAGLTFRTARDRYMVIAVHESTIPNFPTGTGTRVYAILNLESGQTVCGTADQSNIVEFINGIGGRPATMEEMFPPSD